MMRRIAAPSAVHAEKIAKRSVLGKDGPAGGRLTEIATAKTCSPERLEPTAALEFEEEALAVKAADIAPQPPP
jgi:hypothetical protein